jgi:hypothetical protein
MSDRVEKALDELRYALEQCASPNCVSVAITLDAKGLFVEYDIRHPRTLTSAGISMRNLRGEFIGQTGPHTHLKSVIVLSPTGFENSKLSGIMASHLGLNKIVVRSAEGEPFPEYDHLVLTTIYETGARALFEVLEEMVGAGLVAKHLDTE